MKQDTILVFDFGGQYAHLISRRIRENNVYSEIVPNTTTLSEIENIQRRVNVKGIILSGGPSSIYEKNAPKLDKGVLYSPIPVLGICYGLQLIAYSVNGEVTPAKKKEYGISFATIKHAKGILKGLHRREQIWMSHGDSVYSVPDNFEVLASTENCPVAAFMDRQNEIYGIQWHPEVVHTKNGARVISNFIFDICGCKPTWKVVGMLDRYVDEVKRQVGKDKAVVALSGGLDSSTAATIASKALGRNLTAVFVDHGLLRGGEPKQVKVLGKKLGINFVYVDASRRFMEALKGVTDPEQKRKIIGREFIRVFEETAKRYNAKYLVQGTIYPDRIESGQTKNSKVIKTHHNVGGIPSVIKFKGIVEPLRELYKDEVRKIAKQLKLPKEIVYRQPFPGPGLAVRIVGDITERKVEIVRNADNIVRAEIIGRGLDKGMWQYFAVLTDTKSTGVKGDSRSYGSVIAIRAVESTDAMTASFSRIPYEALETISTRITNEIPEVVRVVYDITNKPPSTIEWE
ncbi:MAG: glutamine-hydrolyzing GMP synthase [Candidatus Micrarchaeota archaeon]|nr:glutamine-hydrolyzing GMP synthase [Candidatus Micrarchaeota archaeon]